ncbi:MAG: hypothetical protein ACRDRV_18155 [Pseudonocardiaceae bacterium]
MERLISSNAAALAGLEQANRDIEEEVDALRTRWDIVYHATPLRWREARRRLELIERSEQGAFDGLRRRGVPFQESAEDAVEHEWGLGISRTARGEAILIVGDPTGVTWSDELVSCLTPVAHTHPYFEQGQPRDRHNRVSTATKEIADHKFGEESVPGAVLWSQLADRTESREMQKIFPSASDVAFAAKKGIKTHTVYTPYRVIDHSEGRAIANPDGDAEDPLLSFEIRRAVHLQEKDYGCQLVAMKNGDAFWTKDIATKGDGQFSALTW